MFLAQNHMQITNDSDSIYDKGANNRRHLFKIQITVKG